MPVFFISTRCNPARAAYLVARQQIASVELERVILHVLCGPYLTTGNNWLIEAREAAIEAEAKERAVAQLIA